MKQGLSVTVIIPTYKKFDMLERNLKSLFNQDYDNFEVLVTDDGSTNFPENIESLIKSLNNKNHTYKIIKNKENVGTVKNLNRAIEKSNGEIIMILAGDDYFASKDVISKVIDRFIKTNANVILTSRIVKYEDKDKYYLPHKKSIKRIKKFNTKEKKYTAMVTGMTYCMASGSAMYYKKSIFYSIGGYDEKYILFEDMPFIVKALLTSDIEFAYDITSVYYSEDGVSCANNIHPQLKKDLDLYNKTDRIEHINLLRPFFRKLTLFNIDYYYAGSTKNKLFMILSHPIIFIYKSIYKLKFTFDEKLDILFLRHINEK